MRELAGLGFVLAEPEDPSPVLDILCLRKLLIGLVSFRPAETVEDGSMASRGRARVALELSLWDLIRERIVVHWVI
ncbi:hypothetical protein OGATHE_002098 [Ogataea polymorpha]|uniref:Uncharacterized protein n=1 Tax=Ogataea polymorpha TaxID=460523 RepID=A0A9P8TC71_9ASCO|nr:hypothetical protein OGATHE_002098 [Ogataea polymorpha]